jgi:hypothetical protein
VIEAKFPPRGFFAWLKIFATFDRFVHWTLGTFSSFISRPKNTTIMFFIKGNEYEGKEL